MGRHQEAAPELAAAATNFAGVDRPRQATALHDLALALCGTGRLTDAIAAVQQSRRLYAALGDRRGEARTWYTEGLIHDQGNRTDLAIKSAETSRDLYDPEDPERDNPETALEIYRTRQREQESDTP
jgi:tetratricopeptide (TPR) repeat protein